MSRITAERFRQADALFDAALDLAPSARAGDVRRACGDDAGLRDEVLELLLAHERSAR